MVLSCRQAFVQGWGVGRKFTTPTPKIFKSTTPTPEIFKSTTPTPKIFKSIKLKSS